MLKVELTGNLGFDAKVENKNGDTVMSFSVAVNKKIKNPDGTSKDITTWVNCHKWNKGDYTPAVAQYLKKGTKVFVRGDLTVRTYQGRQGDTQASIDCSITEVELLGGGVASATVANDAPTSAGNLETSVSNAADSAGAAPAPAVSAATGEDDLPF